MSNSEVSIVNPTTNSSSTAVAVNKFRITKLKDVPTWTSARYSLIYLAFFGFFNVYAMRVNLSVAVVSMVNSSAHPPKNITAECPTNQSSSKNTSVGEFDWTSEQSGLVLSAFFYGYIWSQIPGGYIAGRYGGKYLFGIGILCTSVLTLLTPIAARTSYGLLIALRVLEGIGEGVTFPAMHAMLGVWAPPLERAKLASMAYSGASLGTVLAQPLSGILCSSTLLGGWQSVFYVFGAIGCIWCIFWFIFARSSPDKHPRISQLEKEYIAKSLAQNKNCFTKIPWLAFFTSMPVFAIVVANFCSNWGFYTLLTCLPTYLKHILGYDVSEDGFIAALPYFVLWIMVNITGHISDNLLERNILNVTQTRKVFNTIGLTGPAIWLTAVGYTKCNNSLAIAFLCLSTASSACAFSGYNINHIDLSPRYAGILFGITNTAGTIPGFLSPSVVSAITSAYPGRIGWRYVFFISAGIYLFGAIFYAVFSSGKQQPWNDYNSRSMRGENSEHEPLLGDQNRTNTPINLRQ